MRDAPGGGARTATMKYPRRPNASVAVALVIPIVLVAVLGITGYLVYRYALYDALCKSSVNRTLRRYSIPKTPAQIVREFHEKKGEKLSDAEVRRLEKMYRQTDPDQFLAMYDSIRENGSV